MSEEIDGLVEQLLGEPPGARRERLLAQLHGPKRKEALELLAASDLVWEGAHGAPPLEQDPVAAILGVVPDPGFQLDAAALNRACKASHVKPTALAARLLARGWTVETSDVFRWQTRAAPEVPPALIRAIAEELRVDADHLVARSQKRPSALHAAAEDAAATSRFRDLVQRFARAQRISPGMAASALQSRMLATVHRGDVPDSQQMLSSLEALVDALEADEGR